MRAGGERFLGHAPERRGQRARDPARRRSKIFLFDPLKLGVFFYFDFCRRDAVFGRPHGVRETETDAGRVSGPLVSILLQGGFGYEDLRFCTPLAVNDRV
jgi:hypothetical protein